MNNAIIEIKQAHKCWKVKGKKVVVLEDANMQIFPGKSVAIMGPSGIGKSTLMHVLAFLTPLDGGAIFYRGEEYHNRKRNAISEIRKNISFVFQDAKLISGLSVYENVEVPLIHRGVGQRDRIEMIDQALEHVSLMDRKHHYPNQLSGGELMRASIARAIIASPRVIFADEPTGSLDEKMGGKITDLLFSFTHRCISVVVVTHQQKVAEKAERILILKDGKLRSRD